MVFSKQKGITLIALIITIVVLLILVTVAITSIDKYNIIGNANSAAQEYEKKAGEENITLGNYASIIDQYMSGINGGTGSESGSGTGSNPEIGDEGTSGEENSDEITFRINGVEYKAISGWLWNEWLNSEYNTVNAQINREFGCIVIGGHEILDGSRAIEDEEEIKDNYDYALSSVAVPN